MQIFEALPDEEDIWFHGAGGAAPSTVISGQFFWLSRDPKMASGYANGKPSGSVTPYRLLRAHPVNLDRADKVMTPSNIVSRITSQIKMASINKNIAKQEIGRFKEATQNYATAPQPLYYYWYKSPTIAKQFARMILACGFDSVVVNEEGYETLGVLDSTIIQPALGEMNMRDIMDMLAEMEEMEEEIVESADDGVDEFASDATAAIKADDDGVDEFSKKATDDVNDELAEGIAGSIAGGIAGAAVGQPKLGSTLGSMAQDTLFDDEQVDEGIAGSIAGGVAGAAVGQPMLGASLGSMAQDAMVDEEEDVDFSVGMDEDDMELAAIARNAGLDGVEEDALLQKPDQVTHIAGDDVPDTSGLGVHDNGMIIIQPEELMDEGEHVEMQSTDPVDDWYGMFDLGEPEVVDEAPEEPTQPEQHTPEPEKPSNVRDSNGMKVLGKYHSGSGHTVDLMSNQEGTEFALGTNGKASHGISGRMMGDMLFAPDQVPSAAVASAIIDAMTDQGFRVLMDTSHADVVRDVMASDQYMVNIIVDGEDHGAANPAKIAEYLKKSPAIFEDTKFIVSK